MKLLLRGHDDRYAVEQLQLALFPEEPMEPVTEPFSGDGAVSSLHTGAVWLTATAEITLHGKTGRACRRLRAAEADVPARRRLLQNTYYEAAMCLREPPAWGSLSGVRPTKLTTRALLEGKTPAEAEKLLRNGVNRRVNCDAANLDKAVEAAMTQVESIRRLEDQGRLALLPEKLQETASLRLAHPEDTLSQLAQLCDPPITKSALNHRLRKLVELAKAEPEK